MRNTITFGGVDLSTMGLYISGGGTFNAPTRAYDTVEVPGRDGLVILSEKRLENVELTYPAFVYSDFKASMRSLRSFLLSKIGYQRLSDTYHPDEYRLAVYEGGLEVEAVEKLNAGQFELIFNCKPQRWLTSGETAVEFTADGTITNPSYLTSMPLIRAYGTGKFYINDTEVQITAADVYTDIDCDIMECFKGNANKNGMVRLTEFPVLLPGENTITLDGVTSLEITPRWFVL